MGDWGEHRGRVTRSSVSRRSGGGERGFVGHPWTPAGPHGSASPDGSLYHVRQALLTAPTGPGTAAFPATRPAAPSISLRAAAGPPPKLPHENPRMGNWANHTLFSAVLSFPLSILCVLLIL